MYIIVEVCRESVCEVESSYVCYYSLIYFVVLLQGNRCLRFKIDMVVIIKMKGFFWEVMV